MHGLVIQLKNVDFMQKMSCSLPSLEAIHAPRFMRGFMQNTVMRQASCALSMPRIIFLTIQSSVRIELIGRDYFALDKRQNRTELIAL